MHFNSSCGNTNHLMFDTVHVAMEKNITRGVMIQIMKQPELLCDFKSCWLKISEISFLH